MSSNRDRSNKRKLSGDMPRKHALINICRDFQRSGKCPRGNNCRYLHESSNQNEVLTVSKQICRDFKKNGNCSRGDVCRYSHDITFFENEEPKLEICRHFKKTGHCRHGKKCQYLHVEASSSTPDKVSDCHPIDGKEGHPEKKVHITDKRFADLNISPLTKKAISEVFQYEFMTVVQAETLSNILKGNDCLAKAKTGTGKTLAFLIPTVDHLCKTANTRKKDDIECLILSPTRELAFQIQREAEMLIEFHPNIHSLACVGGTNVKKDYRALARSVQILVATPGRLLDHLNNELSARLENMKVLIFDECDQLLDQGFRPDLLRILKHLNSSKDSRQTLLFSATMPDSVNEIAKLALKHDFSYADTVGDHEEQTHLHVKQNLFVTSQECQIEAIEGILTQHTSSMASYKIIVFFTTARLTGFMADLFNLEKDRLGYSILEIHSRKSQAARQKASDKFRTAKKAVLFSSDVSARGMDYPDVTFVLQVGLTERAQYIHRLGRTARAGKNGMGALLLTSYEENWMRKELHDMPLNETNIAEYGCKLLLRNAILKVSKDEDLRNSAEMAYRAWLGFYNGHLKKVGWSKAVLVQHANQWARNVGLNEQPTLLKKTVGKMGLKGVQGLKLE